MAEFRSAIDKVLKHEGGYSNRKSDRGGITYMGITEKNFPHWEGWPIVKSRILRQGQIINNAELTGMVRHFYYKNFWQPMKGDYIEDQRVAEFILDWYVNSGVYALKLAQKAMGLLDDGIVGNKTVAAINKYDSDALFMLLKNERLAMYDRIVARDSSQLANYDGWMNRLGSFA